MKTKAIKSAIVRARVTQKLKDDVTCVLDRVGLSLSDAINLFMAQIKLRKGLPFDVAIPNAKTLESFRDSSENIGLVRSNTVDEMFEKLEN
jgi:DNA-damage-inducible protein J